MKSTLYCILAALTLCGCNSNDEPTPDSTALVITASVSDTGSDATLLWHSGQRFGVYLTETGGNILAANRLHLADDRGTTGYLVPDGEAILLPSDAANLTVTAYYPYDESAAETGHTTLVCVDEKTAGTAYLRATSVGVSLAKPKTSLTFTSILSRVEATIINRWPEAARLVAAIEGAPRSCAYDFLGGHYTGQPVCTPPMGMNFASSGSTFSLSASVAACSASDAGPNLAVKVLDAEGRLLRSLDPIPLGRLLRLTDSRSFEPNTAYKLAGTLSPAGLELQYGGTSAICILNWREDPDEENRTFIK